MGRYATCWRENGPPPALSPADRRYGLAEMPLTSAVLDREKTLLALHQTIQEMKTNIEQRDEDVMDDAVTDAEEEGDLWESPSDCEGIDVTVLDDDDCYDLSTADIAAVMCEGFGYRTTL